MINNEGKFLTPLCVAIVGVIKGTKFSLSNLLLNEFILSNDACWST